MKNGESFDLLFHTDLVDAQEEPETERKSHFVIKDGHSKPASSVGKKLFYALFWVVIILLFVAIVFLAFQGLINYKGHFSTHKSNFSILLNERPPYIEKARMARYFVHKSQWGVLNTFSTHMKGYPWGEVVSVSDGLANNSTGIPLIYISTMDIAANDLAKTPQASFTFSEAQGDWCRQSKIDPEDPRCARVHLFGNITKLTSDEIPSAKKSMFTRHPVMADWPESHHFFFAKIKLTRVEVLDYFGPISEVSVEDYLKAKP